MRFDAIVVGAGQAGPPLAARLSGAGMTVAFVERHRFGGTCVNNGCTPTKAMVASAYAAHLARRHADYGVRIGGPVLVDMKAVKARKDAFVGPKQVKVGETVLEAELIFINVGGRPAEPPMLGLDHVPYLTNESMMEV